MRYMLLPTILLLLLAFHSQAQDGSLVDQYISGSRGELSMTTDPRFPSTPWASRQLKEGGDAIPAEPAASTALALPTIETASTLAGDWSLILQDTQTRSVDLILFQADDVIFGHGTMLEGNTTRLMAAIGEANGDGLALDLLSFGEVNLYRIELAGTAGTYRAFRPDGESWTGMASVLDRP